MMRRSARHRAVSAIATTNAVRYGKKLGRLLWQQAAPFNSSIALLLPEVLYLIVVIALVVVCNVAASPIRHEWKGAPPGGVGSVFALFRVTLVKMLGQSEDDLSWPPDVRW